MKRHYETHWKSGKVVKSTDSASACAASVLSNKTSSDSENTVDSDVELLENKEKSNSNEPEFDQDLMESLLSPEMSGTQYTEGALQISLKNQNLQV